MYSVVDTLKILNEAMKDNEYSYDIYFRMAVIEEYLKGNVGIWDLYNKVQKIRCSQIKHIPLEMQNHKYEFIHLINSIKTYGYDYNYPILLNKDGLIIDGAHRMACSLFFDIPLISVCIDKSSLEHIPSDYSMKWFEKNNLSECILFAEKQQEKVRGKLKCLNQKKS